MTSASEKFGSFVAAVLALLAAGALLMILGSGCKSTNVVPVKYSNL